MQRSETRRKADVARHGFLSAGFLIAIFTTGILFFPLTSNGETLSATRKSELVHLVRQDCGSCHGMTLKGGLGRSLLPGDLTQTTVAELADVILDGIPGTPMPPWRGLISADEALWIAENLKNGLKN